MAALKASRPSSRQGMEPSPSPVMTKKTSFVRLLKGGGLGMPSPTSSPTQRHGRHSPKLMKPSTLRRSSSRSIAGVSRVAKAQQHTKSLLRIPSVQNVKPAIYMTIKDTMEHSPVGYSAMTTNTVRFPNAKPKACSEMANYNIDAGSSMTVATSVTKASDYLKWKPLTGDPRQDERTHVRDANELSYDTDTGPNMTLRSAVSRSPIRYAGMRSPTPRFTMDRETYESQFRGPGYIDPNDSVTSGRARTPAVDFNASRTPRFKDAVEGGPDSAVYAAAMQQGAAASIAAKVARSPQRYSGMSSPTPRRIEAPKDRALVAALASLETRAEVAMAKEITKSPRNPYKAAFSHASPRLLPPTAGRDRATIEALRNLDYNPDTGTISAGVRQSNLKYSGMTSPTPRFAAPVTEFAKSPGPGAIDPHFSLVHPRAQVADFNRERAPRFSPPPTQSSSFSPEQTTWEGKAPVWSKSRAAQRGAVEKKFLDKEYSVDSSLATSVAKSRKNPHITFKSKLYRQPLEAPRNPEHLGPGTHSPNVLHHGHGYTIGQEPLSPRRKGSPGSSMFLSTPRFK